MDAKNFGFQCATSANDRFFRTYYEGRDFQCVGIVDLEDILKACKNHQVLKTTQCKLTKRLTYFECVMPNGEKFDLSHEEADNYFCMSPKDHKRVLQRCQMPSGNNAYVIDAAYKFFYGSRTDSVKSDSRPSKF